MDTKTRLLMMYRGFNASEKLIALNITIFTIMVIFNAFFRSIYGTPPTFFYEYFAIPKDLGELLVKPWTIVTYAFIHADFFHVIFNCIGLYFTGKIFYNFFTEKQFITVYAYGIFAGAVLFLIAYNVLPAFAEQRAVLMGASAAVLAIMAAGATYAPNLIVNLFGVLPVKYWILAILLMISYIAAIGQGSNEGGHFAHIGGALIGYLFVKQLQKGNDIGIGFERFWDKLVAFFTPKKKSPLKTVYKNKETKRSTTKKTTQTTSEKQRKIDAILDKISKSGYESLTKAEKDFLFKAGKDN
ncbi:membrane associated rhomboid family serine protease [Kordia periserrulae]|uniref:Membrane associated rhomboid family serine protease n=1 Tax=Kordia periserrulae TaxID=701523 RepID=A0A2T6C0V9_9FLAO|nr:rhomboid family intramembrane serine protease [Kordia periserrulae]PTX61958.1 membrane associated rhomboid family serine protease [Kordia periserrulae]